MEWNVLVGVIIIFAVAIGLFSIKKKSKKVEGGSSESLPFLYQA